MEFWWVPVAVGCLPPVRTTRSVAHFILESILAGGELVPHGFYRHLADLRPDSRGYGPHVRRWSVGISVRIFPVLIGRRLIQPVAELLPKILDVPRGSIQKS